MSVSRRNAIVKIACYCWAAPSSVVGLLFLFPTLGTGGAAQVVDGVLELSGGAAEWWLRRVVGLWLRGGASAMTLGHVVLGRDGRALQTTRAHERVHVRQCECWGPIFIPAYLLASLWMWLRGREPYRDNPFEREAFSETE
jgi:hypothetical protein